jgi:hypothetical protein
VGKLKKILIFILFCSANLMAKDIIPYASIGMRIGWDFKCGLTISPKLSFGLAEIQEGTFINLTLGTREFQKPIVGSGEFRYLDVQAGTVFEKLPGVLFGGDIGLLFGKSNEGTKIIPRSTVFSGCFLFPTIEMTYWNRSKISYDAGAEAVLPIPLGPIDFGSIGGE